MVVKYLNWMLAEQIWKNQSLYWIFDRPIGLRHEINTLHRLATGRWSATHPA